MKLQDYALQFLLSQTYTSPDMEKKVPLIDKLIVGCTEAGHILHDLEVIHQHILLSESSQTP